MKRHTCLKHCLAGILYAVVNKLGCAVNDNGRRAGNRNSIQYDRGALALYGERGQTCRKIGGACRIGVNFSSALFADIGESAHSRAVRVDEGEGVCALGIERYRVGLACGDRSTVIAEDIEKGNGVRVKRYHAVRDGSGSAREIILILGEGVGGEVVIVIYGVAVRIRRKKEYDRRIAHRADIFGDIELCISLNGRELRNRCAAIDRAEVYLAVCKECGGVFHGEIFRKARTDKTVNLDRLSRIGEHAEVEKNALKLLVASCLIYKVGYLRADIRGNALQGQRVAVSLVSDRRAVR